MRQSEIFNLLKSIVKRSYSPYSKFPVAALLFGEDGTFSEGVNVENASYGLTSCAERNALFGFVSRGMIKPKSLHLYAQTESFTPPCGACRQVLMEMCPKLEITVYNIKGETKRMAIEELVPYPFLEENLEKED